MDNSSGGVDENFITFDMKGLTPSIPQKQVLTPQHMDTDELINDVYRNDPSSGAFAGAKRGGGEPHSYL